MGEYILKRFSITLILVSASLNVIFNVSNLIQIFVGGLDFLDYYIAMHLRFGELGIIFGFVGLYVSANDNKTLKNLSLIYMLLGFSKFLLVEYQLVQGYGFWSVFITGMMAAAIAMLVISKGKQASTALFVKGVALSVASGVYWLALVITSIISLYQDLNTSQMAVTHTVLPFFYVIFLIGLWVYFYEYYKEVFIYKIKMIRIQKNEELEKNL